MNSKKVYSPTLNKLQQVTYPYEFNLWELYRNNIRKNHYAFVLEIF